MKSVACAVAVLAAAPLSDAGVVAVKKASTVIEPELDPKTHEEWEKDYPIDVAHGAKLKLKGPYPKLQDSDDFDKDYVKDENNNKMDKKSWDDQLKYAKAVSDAAEEVDRLKNKLKDLEKALEDAKNKDEEEGKEYDKAKKEEDALGDGPKDFKADVEEVDDVSTKEVEKEISDLEECKKQLEEAKKKLAELQKEADAAHAAENTAESVKVEAINFEKVAEEKHEIAEKALEEEEKEYDKAKKTHAEEKEILDKMEKELKEAEDKLRSFRGGGGSQESHSGAASLKSTILATAVVLTSFVYTSTA